MSEPKAYLHLVRGALLPAACICVTGYFAYHALAGNTGLLAWGGYKAEKVALTREAEAVAARKAALERRVALLDPRRVDPDLADELVRGNLGLVRPDEVILPLPK